MNPIEPTIQKRLQDGVVIPAHPLALTKQRKLSERHQRGLSRYYIAAGAGGLAVGVHTTQFQIHDSAVGLYQPVLELAAEEMGRWTPSSHHPLIRVAGLCGSTKAATDEAQIAANLNYHAGLLNLNAMAGASEDQIIDHVRAVSEIIPVFGFYLQGAIGGLTLPYAFWRRFCQIQNVVAIKVAAFNRYQTIDVVRAVAESGRTDIALYTGNDDNILADLLTPFRYPVKGQTVERRFTGGLLGHWAVWTKRAVELLATVKQNTPGATIPTQLLRLANEITDMNAALFDPQNNFAGCIPGIHEILHRQQLLPNTHTLNPNDRLSVNQARELDRVCTAYPHLTDDAFIDQHRDDWLSG